MKSTGRILVGVVACAVALAACAAMAEDWPQWRGPGRDAKATGFPVPKAWPKDLVQKWKVPVGVGSDSTPALVGDRLFVFGREGDEEFLSCLNLADGKEVWKDKYKAPAVTGSAASHPGPRSSPAVADGKVFTLGVDGTVSCLDAKGDGAKGKVLWRKKDFPAVPKFFTSSSPLVEGGLCVVQLGGEGKGALVAYNVADGTIKWQWTGDAAAYSSPALLTVEGTKLVVAMGEKNMVAVALADGSLVWQAPFVAAYNAPSPVVDGPVLIYTAGGRGITAVKFEKKDGAVKATGLWSNKETSSQYSSPVLKDGRLYFLSMPAAGGGARGGRGGMGGSAPAGRGAPAGGAAPAGAASAPASAPAGGGMAGGRGGRGGGGGMRGGGGKFVCVDAKDGKTLWTDEKDRGSTYAELVDVGPVILALTSGMQLVVIEPDATACKEAAAYKVADKPTYAYPVPCAKGIIIRDQANVALWAAE